jgi:hypothetical protein
LSNYYTSEELINSVKRIVSIPINQNTFTNADILSYADEELSLVVVPAIISLHEDYLLFSEDVDLETDVSEYTIPYRAVGNKLYDLQYIDSASNVLPMSRTTAADEVNYNTYSSFKNAYAYYLKNSNVHLMPALNNEATGALRFIYYIRPSSLVLTTAVAVISSIDTDTGEIVVTGVPDTFSTSTPLDFYRVKSPHNVLSIDKTPTSVSSASNTITFDTEDLPSGLAAGDHISLAQQCAIPQIPSDLHVFLAQKTSERILEALGDSEGLQIARQKSAEMETRAGTIIDNRVEESPIKLSNRNGILRSGILRIRR